MFRVEPAEVSAAAERMGASAQDLAGVELRSPFERAAAAVPGSGLSGEADRLAGELAACLQSLAEAVLVMEQTAASNVGRYTAADTVIKGQFTAATRPGVQPW